MGDINIDRVLGRIERGINQHLSGPQNESLIRSAERDLGVTFPRDYRAFVSKFGLGFVGAYEIMGVDSGEAIWPNIVRVNKDLREHAGLDSSGLVVYFDGAEDYYFLCIPEGDDPSIRAWSDWQPLDVTDRSIVFPSFAHMLTYFLDSSEGYPSE